MTTKKTTTLITPVEAKSTSEDAPTKKLVIVGLPTTAAAKTGFGAGDNRPGYKEKSSKKTGAKYRVRQ